MNDSVGNAAVQSNFIQTAQYDPIQGASNLEDLLEKFGPEGVTNAMSQEYLNEVFDDLKDLINNSDLTQKTKDMLISLINSHQAQLNSTMPASAEAQQGVANSSVGETSRSMGSETVAEADATASTAPADATSSEIQAEAEAEAANEGSATGLSDGGYTPDGMDLAEEGRAAGSEKKRGKGRNWLEKLAIALADIQSTFLDRALAAADVMSAEADNVAGDGGGETTSTGSAEGSNTEGGGGEGEGANAASGGKSKAFLEAQATYTANMQLFTTFSNQVSTSIKTIGEAIAGISRKQ